MDDERVDEIFARIEEIDIELDYDPIERGPKHLNNMVAKCRNYTNEVQKFMRECQMFLRTVERQLLRKEADFEMQYNDLMANDAEIIQMRGLSKADREALANTKLQTEIGEINELSQALTDAKHVETVIDSKLRELRDVNRDIRLQKQLIQAEIETGAMWGNDHGPQDYTHHGSGDVDVDAEDMFENPDDDPETKGKEEEPDYEDLFVMDGGSDDEEENEITEEKTDQALDNSDQSVKVSVKSDADQAEDGQPEEPIFQDESEMEFDFEAALERMG